MPPEATYSRRAESRPSASVLSVRLLDDAADLIPYTAAWEELADNALEPNVFYEPWMLLTTLEAYGAGEKRLFALVFEGDPQAGPEKRRLFGLWPWLRALKRRLSGPRHLLPSPANSEEEAPA